MIKDLILKYKNVAFICNNRNDFICFIEESTKQIEYSKGGIIGHDHRWVEDKDYLLKYYLRPNKTIILNLLVNKGEYEEYQFYSREYGDYSKYTDWDRYKIIDYSLLLRFEKVKKLKNEIIHKKNSM